MKNSVNKMAKNSQKIEGNLSWLDLPKMKEIFAKALELNIALKSFNSSKAQTDRQRDMMQQSIYNSQKGLERLKEVENAESLNLLILNIGAENWATFTTILSFISGSLNDNQFYETDKKITETKISGKA